MKRVGMMIAIAMGLTSIALAQTPAEVHVTKADKDTAQLGSTNNFTGIVYVTNRFKGQGPARISGATVTFEPQARTAWHSHPLGQTLIVTKGAGRVQHWGGAVQEINIGDTVWIPPGVKHWHGASSTTAMQHIAVAETLNGKTVDWMEPVTDAQYAGL